MPYDYNMISQRWIGTWDSSNYCMFRYTPWSSGQGDLTTGWVLDFKKNYDEAVALAADVVTSLLIRDEAQFRGAESYVDMVTIPSHAAYTPNAGGERLCQIVARAVPWVRHSPNALVRVEGVQKSATAGAGQRPGYSEHYQSIRYEGPSPAMKRIIMFDDVLTKGSTSTACRDILRDATGCKQVVGLFLSKTIR